MSAVVRLLAARVHYGWVVVAVAFVVLLAAAGIRASPSVILVPLEQDFGWSRTTISLAVSINLVLFGLMGPFSAALMERIGIRLTVVMALAVLALGVALSAGMTAPWQMVLIWGFLVGGGTGVTAITLAATIVGRWFAERRGLAMGILTASSATGQLVFLPVLAAIVERFGWRSVVLTVAAVAAAIIPLVLIFVQERPEAVGLRPYGERGAVRPAAGRAGNPIATAFRALAEASRSRDFWLLFASFYVCGASTNGLIGTHLIAACLDHGIPEVQSAGLLAGMGLFDLIGTMGSGWLSDRCNNRVLLFWYYGLRGLSLLYLPFAFDLTFYGLSLFAVFYGLDWVATVPPTARLTADVFGKEKAPIIFGWIVAGHQLGAGSAAAVAGIMRANIGSYMESFMLSGVLCLVGAVMVLRIGRRADADPGATEAAPA